MPADAGGPHRRCHVKRCYIEVVSRANVTLSIDKDLLREARILAAQEGTSVSRLLADRLEALIRRHKSRVASTIGRASSSKASGATAPAS